MYFQRGNNAKIITLPGTLFLWRFGQRRSFGKCQPVRNQKDGQHDYLAGHTNRAYHFFDKDFQKHQPETKQHAKCGNGKSPLKFLKICRYENSNIASQTNKSDRNTQEARQIAGRDRFAINRFAQIAHTQYILAYKFVIEVHRQPHPDQSKDHYHQAFVLEKCKIHYNFILLLVTVCARSGIQNRGMTDPRQLLLQYFGYDTFREPQESIIQSILAGRSTLALLPTGQGKSVCFQIPGLALNGLTIVISPLIALMKDQVDALNKKGITAHYVNSTLSKREVKNKYADIRSGRCRFVYVAPERLLTQRFLSVMRDCPPSFVAVDEAHCFSTWGHDFRPRYRDIPKFLKLLPNPPRLALFTATASKMVVEDLQKSFQIRPENTFRGSFFRNNLFIATRRFELHSQRFSYLLYRLHRVHAQESGLIYVSTRHQAETLCQALHRLDSPRRLTVDYYHAGRSTEEKNRLQEKFLNDDIKIMIATNAFGMGIDKANIRFVIHFALPGSLENYVQEIGRAGRDRQFSWCELLLHPGDILMQRQMEAGKQKHHDSLAPMIQFAEQQTCHHQKIMSYFQDPQQFPHGCARCEYCSPYSQLFLKEMQKKVPRVRRLNGLSTFAAQKQLILRSV